LNSSCLKSWWAFVDAIRQPTPQPYSFILSFVYSTFEIAGKTAFKNTSDQCKMPATLSTNLRTNHNPLVAEEEEEETDFCAAGDEEAPSKTGKRRV